MTMKLSDEVLAVLSTLAISNPEGPFRAVHVRITEQLDRALYVKVDKALQTLGGKWTRGIKAHVFPFEDLRDRIDLAITTGEVATARDIGWFPTPAPLARQLVEMANIGPLDHVLEPSAGDGAIVEAILEHKPMRVTAIEIDPGRFRSLQTKQQANVGWRSVALHEQDFMDCGIRSFGRVVMNPPFCKSGLGNHLDHLEHAFGLLAPGGVLVSVLPSSITFRRDRRHAETRGWILKHGTITDLPDGSFKESGTGVRTCVARMTKLS